jgi:methionyl-tRNA formyltransferase
VARVLPQQPVSISARQFPGKPLGRPIRVVLFGGAFFEPMALRFVAMLEEHRDIELVGGFSQSRGFGVRHRVADIVSRRKALAPAVLAAYAARSAVGFFRHPRAELSLRRKVRGALRRIRTVPDIHATGVLNEVRRLSADLGLIYGAPKLKPELFDIPRFGTLGIHHGKLPHYRGKKTTFWAMFNGDATAGVAIQRINAGLDTGEVVSAGEVSIGQKRYGRVDAELQELGLTLFVNAILSVKRGDARPRPQPLGSSRLYRQPRLLDILRLWWRRLTAPPAES